MWGICNRFFFFWWSWHQLLFSHSIHLNWGLIEGRQVAPAFLGFVHAHWLFYWVRLYPPSQTSNIWMKWARDFYFFFSKERPIDREHAQLGIASSWSLVLFFFGRRLTDLFVVRGKRPILFAWMIFTAWALAHPFFFLFLLQDINQKWDWISSLLLYKFIQFAGFQYHNRLNSIRESSIYSAFRLALSLCQRIEKSL